MRDKNGIMRDKNVPPSRDHINRPLEEHVPECIPVKAERKLERKLERK